MSLPHREKKDTLKHTELTAPNNCSVAQLLFLFFLFVFLLLCFPFASQTQKCYTLYWIHIALWWRNMKQKSEAERWHSDASTCFFFFLYLFFAKKGEIPLPYDTVQSSSPTLSVPTARHTTGQGELSHSLSNIHMVGSKNIYKTQGSAQTNPCIN